MVIYVRDKNMGNEPVRLCCEYVEQALVNVTEQIYKSIDKGKISLLVLLGLSTAFDSVNHDLLL